MKSVKNVVFEVKLSIFLQVDGKDLRNATHDQAVEIIRHASNPVRFVVQSLGDPACVSYYSCCNS